jgi:hypothetical protein
MPSNVIKVLEVQSDGNPDELQSNLAVADECGNKSFTHSKTYLNCFLKYNLYEGNVDECAAAANIYQCGKENAPSVTDAIQSALTDSTPSNVSFEDLVL